MHVCFHNRDNWDSEKKAAEKDLSGLFLAIGEKLWSMTTESLYKATSS